MTTKLYVVEQSKWPSGDIGGCLMTAAGDVIYSHMSSSSSWLLRDLTVNFGRAKELEVRFGEYEVIQVHLGSDLPDEIAHHFGPAAQEES